MGDGKSEVGRLKLEGHQGINLAVSSIVSAPTPEDLSERSFKFACAVYDYCDELIQLRGLPARLGYQLWDAASSVGANRAEAKSSYSNKEFASKNAICLKEARESLFWLRVAEAKNIGDPERRTYLLNESNQLVAIYSTLVKTLQAKLQ